MASIRFTGLAQHTLLNQYNLIVENVAPYQSGQFYKREMPCLLASIEQVKEPFDVIIIDGFVFLDGQYKAGLGKHLYDNLSEKKPIIGIAKNAFAGMGDEFAVYRGISKHPLYVTACGFSGDFSLEKIQDLVKELQGKFRLPDIVTQVDKLSRKSLG